VEDASWEDYEDFANKFSDFIHEDMNFVEEGVMRREIEKLGLAVETVAPFKQLNVAGKENGPNGLALSEKDEVGSVEGKLATRQKSPRKELCK
jgi:hypothetical protein